MSASAIFARLRCAPAVSLALLVALLGALAPTLSHALAAARGAPMTIEVCSSNGTRWLVVDSPKSATTPTTLNALNKTDSRDRKDSGPDLDHCPFCLLSTDRDAPAPHPLVHLFVVLGDPLEPTVRQAFFFSSHYTLAAPARGPPVRS